MILVFIAAVANGVADSIRFDNPFPESKFWSKDSWRNVYKNGNIEDGERFFLSGSVFSFLCDGWHLMKLIMIESLCIAFAVQYGLLGYLFFRTIYFIGFNIAYK